MSKQNLNQQPILIMLVFSPIKLFELHDFSLVLSKKKSYCVIACMDYPRCDETITIFLRRDWLCILRLREVYFLNRYIAHKIGLQFRMMDGICQLPLISMIGVVNGLIVDV